MDKIKKKKCFYSKLLSVHYCIKFYDYHLPVHTLKCFSPLLYFSKGHIITIKENIIQIALLVEIVIVNCVEYN